MNNTLEKPKRKLSLGIKLGYGMGSFGENLAYNVFYTYFLVFLTNYAGINAGIAGTIALVAVLWDGVIGVLAGYCSDRSTNPKGKRRPFMSRFAVPFGIMCCLLFSDFGLTGGAQIAYFIVMNVVFWLFFELTDVPYLTFANEITNDPSEKLSLRSYATMLNYGGYLVAASLTLQFVNFFEGLLGNSSRAWTATCAVFGIMIAVSYLIVVAITKGREKTTAPSQTENNHRTFGDSVTALIHTLKVKPYRNLWTYSALFNVAIFACTSTIVYIIQYVCGGDDNDISIILALYAVFTIIISAVIGRIADKAGNKNVLLIGTIAAGVALTAFYILPLTLFTINIMMLAIAIGMSSFYVVSYAMLYDVADVSCLKTGTKDDGILVAFYQFAQKFGGAVGMWLAGQLLDYFQYDASRPITDYTIQGIRFSTTAVPGIIILLSLTVLLLYGLKKGRVERLRKMLDKETLSEDDKAYIEKVL